jgi:hypothetical protein
MSVEQIEQSVLKLSDEERRQFADWFFQHEAEIIGTPDDDFIHPSVKAEVLRRRDEVEAHPELLEPVTAEWFEKLKRKLADARTAKASAR